MKKHLGIILRGTLMGAADVVPGVSGGTIAFITGIYEQLITTIDGLGFGFFKDCKDIGVYNSFKKYQLDFLTALIIGIAISVLSLSKLLTYLRFNYPILVWSFFFGLVVASVWYIGRKITKWHLATIIALCIGSLLSYWITIADPISTPDSWWFLICSGFIAIIAMILPGVSGAFLLLLLGSYDSVLESISGCIESLIEGNWSQAWIYLKNLIFVAIGAIIGIKVFSKALKWLFNHYENLTLAVLTGFMIGSLNKLWPWKETLSIRTNSHGEIVPFIQRSILPGSYDGNAQIVYAISLIITGFFLILILEKLATKK